MSITNRVLVIATVAALGVTLLASGSAVAGKGKGGKLETTISFSSETFVAAASADSDMSMVYGDVNFMVTRSYPYDKDTIWVTNTCWDADGNVVVDRDRAVMWGASTSLEGETGDMPTGGVICTAYTTLRPWQDRPMDEPIVYEVGG